ncbi:MAG: preprotein translocase subunit SecG [Clostridia bacterium]|nr:preprotein translocase subunit SecG [Clostridia bacterium]
MVVLEYILIAVLIIAAFVIIAAVLLQKSNEDGLSGTIAGGSETFYGKDKSSHTDRTLFKWTVIASIVFAVAVLVVYIIQPDYSQGFSLEDWTNEYLNNYSDIVDKIGK